MNAQDLLKEIDKDRDSHIAFLRAFVQAPSPNPPGDTRAAPEMPNVVSDFTCADTKGPRLIMNGHIDVFPVGENDGWTRDPWSGEVDKGWLHGRGTVDMKAGTAASIIAYSYIYQYRDHLRGSLGLCTASDEETGGKWGSRFLLDDPRWKGDYMINGEPGGLNTIRFAEKGSLRLTFTITTPGVHGAYVHKSGSATRIAAKLIDALAAVEDIVSDVPPSLVEYMKRSDIRDAIDLSLDPGAADIMLKPTLNVGIIHGELKVNMIPGSCVFETDIRLPVGLKATQVMEVIYGILPAYPETTVSIQEAASNPASLCSHVHPMVDILARNAKTVTGNKPLAIQSLGATDCKFWRYKDVPAYVFGVSPESMAARGESVSIDEFIAVLKTHVLSAWEYLGGST